MASDAGRIRSINPRKGSRANINGGIVAGWTQLVRPGYARQCVALRKGGKTCIKKVHRVILETFVGPCPDGMEALHDNGNALDNRLGNLRWGTHLQNVDDCVKHGRKSDPPIHWAERHPNARLTTEQVLMVRRHNYKRGDVLAFARRFGVSTETIARIRDGRSRSRG